MNFDHQHDETGSVIRFLEAAIAIFGVLLLAAVVTLYAFLP